MLGWLWVLGCGADVEGVWEGRCTVETVKGEARYELAYAIAQDGGALAGEAEVEAPFLTEPIAGILSGTVADDEVALTAEMGDPTLNFRITHELTLDRPAETLRGPCAVQVQEEPPFDGEASLTLAGALPEED